MVNAGLSAKSMNDVLSDSNRCKAVIGQLEKRKKKALRQLVN